MTDQADLAYLKSVAESGQSAPLLGGRFFLWWGGLASIALLVHWAILAQVLAVQPAWIGARWAGYGIIGGTGASFLARSLRNKPGLGATSTRSERAVWMAMTATVFAYAIGIVVANSINAFDLSLIILFDTIPLVAFGGYGIAFYVTTALGGPKWMGHLAPVAWVASGVGVYWVGTPHLYLFAAAVTAVLGVLPGIILMRNEPPAERESE